MTDKSTQILTFGNGEWSRSSLQGLEKFKRGRLQLGGLALNLQETSLVQPPKLLLLWIQLHKFLSGEEV